MMTATRRYETEDKNFIIAMMTVGFKIVNSYPKKGKLVFFVFDRDQAIDVAGKPVGFDEIVANWFTNTPIPCSDVRQMIVAQEIFKAHIKEHAFSDNK